MQSDAAADEIKRLQRCISDLMVVMALPAIWKSHEPSQIANTLLDVLFRMLRLDVACVRCSTSVDESKTEWTRPSSPAGVDLHEMAIFRLGLAEDVGMLVVGSRRSDFPTTIEKLLIQVAANAAAVGLQEARYARQQQRANAELERRVKRAMDVNRDLARRLIASQEAERQRIALELHDDLSQKIAMLNVEIDQIAVEAPTDAVRSSLRTISGRVAEIARDVRNLSHQLYPPMLQMLGVQTAIQALCRDMSQQGRVDVIFTYDGPLQPVDRNVSLCLYRVAQAALHNVAQHSRAREAHVRLTRAEDAVQLQIVDSGVGFDPHAQHEGLGLVSMRERVAVVNGQLTVESAAGGGTRIDVRVPLSRSAG